MDRSQLLALRLEGRSYADIAAIVGLSPQRVMQLLLPPKQIKDFVKRRANGLCEECGVNAERGGQIHHKSQDVGPDTYDDITNLQLLCSPCHMRLHAIPAQLERRQEMTLSQCRRCGYQWAPRVAFPVTCPNQVCQAPWPLGKDPARFAPKAQERERIP